MSTQTTCDYPDCRRLATWKVELTAIPSQGTYSFGGGSWSIVETKMSVDTCSKHLVRVSMDPDEIAEFQKKAKS